MRLVEFTKGDRIFFTYGHDPERWWLDRRGIVPGKIGDLLRDEPEFSACRFAPKRLDSGLCVPALRLAVSLADRAGLDVVNRLPRAPRRRPVACHRRGEWMRFDTLTDAALAFGTDSIRISRWCGLGGSIRSYDWFDLA